MAHLSRTVGPGGSTRSSRSSRSRMQALPHAGALALALGCLLALARGGAALSEDFYRSSCPSLDDVVRDRVKAALENDITLGGAFLRLLFHDCFVRGCDASLLLVGAPGEETEQDAGPNTGVRGGDLIEEIKGRLQGPCPDVVSCADIEVLVGKEIILQMGGPVIGLRLGRRDGTVSIRDEAQAAFPSPEASVVDQKDRTMKHTGLALLDLVALSGAHTIGRARCFLFENRWKKPDTSIDPAFRDSIRGRCPDPDQQLDLDHSTPIHFDNQYYKNLLEHKGLMTSDQVFALDRETRPMVERFANDQGAFFDQFATSFVKLTEANAIEFPVGEIRRVCSARN